MWPLLRFEVVGGGEVEEGEAEERREADSSFEGVTSSNSPVILFFM